MLFRSPRLPCHRRYHFPDGVLFSGSWRSIQARSSFRPRSSSLVLALRRRGLAIPVLLRLLVGRLISSGLNDRPPVSPFSVGLRCRCPRCGIGKLFNLFLIVSDIYEHCDLALKAAASGDRSAVFVMFIIAPIATGLALW